MLGLTLLLLLIVLFFAATVIPKSMGSPPQYEMLFTTLRYSYQDVPEYLLDYAVKDQKITVKARKNDDNTKNFNTKQLMVYDGKTETVREINVDITKTTDATNGNEAVLEEKKHDYRSIECFT